MSREQGYHEFGFMNRKCSPQEVRKFVSDALDNEGAANVVEPSGRMITLKVSYVCESPPFGKFISEERDPINEAFKKKAEELIAEDRRQRRKRQMWP